MKKALGLVIKEDVHALQQAGALEQWLRRKGCDVVRKAGEPFHRPAGEKKAASIAPPHLYCVLVLGGDGTFLSAVRWLGDQPIPILGIKFGEVGFLADTVAERIFYSG